jgi:glycosyltransferase involved in cell wall biosynthesis
MESEPEAIRWLNELKISPAVDLLPKLSRLELAELFRKAQISVSPTTHDGTPNTLLEAMACGSFPVAGDLDSIREWITPGVNGLLVDSSIPTASRGHTHRAGPTRICVEKAAQINSSCFENGLNITM